MKEHPAVYQLEVKRWLVAYRFPPSRGWQTRVDIDAMERAKGGQHRPDKASVRALPRIREAIKAQKEKDRAQLSL